MQPLHNDRSQPMQPLHNDQSQPMQPMQNDRSQPLPYVPGANPGPYQPHVPPQLAQHGGPQGPKPSRKGLIIGLVVGGAAVAGIVVALVLVLGGKGSAVGGSRDGVIRATFSALERGDAKTLVALTGIEHVHKKLFDCEDLDDKDSDSEFERDMRERRKEERDPKLALARIERHAELMAARAKGSRIEVVEIVTKLPEPMKESEKKKKKKKKRTDDDDDDDDRDRRRKRDSDDDDDDDDDEGGRKNRKRDVMVIKEGEEIMKGCTAKQTFRYQLVKVELKINDGQAEDKEPIEDDFKIAVVEVDGGWYLVDIPSVPVGFVAVADKLDELKGEMCKCKDAKCSAPLKRRVEELDVGKYDDENKKRMPTAIRERVEKAYEEVSKCQAIAKGGEALAKLSEFSDQMCACKDVACSESVYTKQRDYERDHISDRPSDYEVLDKMSEYRRKLTDCRMKLLSESLAIESVTPDHGDTIGGTYVTIKGRGFTATPRTARIYFGYRSAMLVRYASDTEMIVQAPSGIAGDSVDVRVTFDPGGEKTLTKAFRWDNGPVPDAAEADLKLPKVTGAPVECEKYRQAMIKLYTCAKYPANGRTGMVEAWNAISRQISSSRRTSADMCKRGEKPMVDLASTLGC